ncbi:MAG: serine/threonine protein kinase, partial [Myxococcales bacterium]|nr:serine/threonine protein kinase [Myxococcales bacterium]
MIRDGTIIDGKYCVLRPLGGGAMGKVFLAEKISTHERYAIKFIHDYLVSDETYYARFEREINALRGIRHPHVVSVWDWNLPPRGQPGNAYIVMEYLTGESMQQALMRPQGMSLDLVIRIMLQVLEGLEAVHRLGVIHRDLSPANVFLAGNDPLYPSAKIVDFGLAKGEAASSASDSQGGVTQDGAVLGRAAYAAPEMFLGRELDARADIFACGMIMYRALAGRFPYREAKTELMWVERYAERHEEGRPYVSARTYKPSIPAPVDQLISLAIRKRPSERYQSAEQMQRDLLKVEALLRQTPQLAKAYRPEPAPPPLPEALPMPSTTRVEVPPAGSSSSARSRAQLALAAAAADSGSPTPGPSAHLTMPSVHNWLAQDDSRARAVAHRSGPQRWAARHPRAVLGIAAGLLLTGILSVALALLLRGGRGAAGDDEARVAQATAPGAVPATPQDQPGAGDPGVVPRDADAGAVPAAPANLAPPPRDASPGPAQDAAGDGEKDAAVQDAPPEALSAKVKITLEGLPEDATATVAGKRVVDGVVELNRSDKEVHVRVRARGFRPFEGVLVPNEDVYFLVELEPLSAPGADGGTA